MTSAPTRHAERPSTPSSRIASISRGDEPAGQPVLRDALDHHPAEAIVGLVDGDRVAGEAQIVGGGEACGATSDDADRRARRRGNWPCASCHTAAPAKLDAVALADEALERADRDRRVTVPRRHAVSHGAAHTLPQIDAKGWGPER